MTEKMTAAQFKKTAKKKRVDREGPIQIEIVEFLRDILPDAIVHHCKNEINLSGKNIAREIAKGKRAGVVTGFPDIMILPYAAKLRAMFLEVKAEGNYATPAQKEVHARLKHLGYPVAVVRSVQDVRECLREWGVGWAENIPIVGEVYSGKVVWK